MYGQTRNYCYYYQQQQQQNYKDFDQQFFCLRNWVFVLSSSPMFTADADVVDLSLSLSPLTSNP